MNVKNIKAIFAKEVPFFMMVPALLWQILFFCIPLVFIVYLAFATNWNAITTLGFTLENFKALADITYFKIILRSFILALGNAVLCLLLGYPVAYFIAHNGRRFKNILLFFLILPFWTNLLVLVYSWFFILERYGLINVVLLKLGLITEPLHLLNTSVAILLGTCYCYLPFMILPLYSTLEKLDPNLLEASSDLGADVRQTFLYVTLPQSIPGIKTGFFLVLVPSFGEFVIPVLLGGGKQMYVGSLISHLFVVAQNPFLGAAFTIVSSLLLLMFSIGFNWVIKKYFSPTVGEWND